MKHFFSSVLRCKMQACIIFAASVILALIASLIFPDWDVTEGMLWQMLLISAVGALFSWLAYSEDVFKKLRYAVRHLIFAPAFLAFLSACAYFFRWFPPGYFGAWLLFIGIFLLAFAGIGVGFHICAKVTGQKYGRLLEDYKKENVK